MRIGLVDRIAQDDDHPCIGDRVSDVRGGIFTEQIERRGLAAFCVGRRGCEERPIGVDIGDRIVDIVGPRKT